MKKPLIYILFTCLLVTSCRKNELPKEEEQDQPVFYFKGDVNGVPVKIEAGVDNYVMNSSHYQDNNNLYIYKSELKQLNCTGNCGFALSVLINDNQLSDLNGVMDIENALKTGTHGFNDGNIKDVFYKGNFSAHEIDNVPGDPYTWTFLSASTSWTEQGKEVTKDFEAGQQISVNLKFEDPAGFEGTLTKDYKIGNPLQANISRTNNKFSAKSTVPTVDRTWDFGDGSAISKEESPEHIYPSATLEYVATLTLTDTNGNSCISKYLIDPDTEGNYDATFTPFLNPKVASAITLLFTDQNGFTYSSAELNQPTASKFEIISVENYKNNDKKEPTKKIKITFNCSFNSSTGPVNISNGEAVIAVSYK